MKYFQSRNSVFRRVILTSLLLFSFASMSLVFAENDEFHRFWPDNLFAVEMVERDFVVMGGYSGTILRSENAGKTWQAIYIGKNELIRRISFVDKNNGWAVGHRGTIFNTTDGALSWSVQHSIPGVYLRDIDFSDTKNGWAIGHDANIWNTKDGGLTWSQQKLIGFTGRDVPRLHGVSATSKDSAILVGEFGVVAHTEDGGKHWIVTPVKNKITYLSVSSNQNKTFLVGLEGTIVELVDATDEERVMMEQMVLKAASKKEKRARAKAKRKKKEYIPPPPPSNYRPSIEYVLKNIESNTKEHLFDVATAADGSAIVVGRSIVSRIKDGAVTSLTAAENFPLSFIWLGGVALSSNGDFWAPGIRGLMVKGSLSGMTYLQGGHLAASPNIELVSSRWRLNNEQ